MCSRLILYGRCIVKHTRLIKSRIKLPAGRLRIQPDLKFLAGRTIERKVIALNKDVILVGRIAHIININKAGRREIN